jgi:hypothetical protein
MPITPKICAVAVDGYLTPQHKFPDSQNLSGFVPRYGQDITFGTGRTAPAKQSVGANPTELVPKMQQLLSIFAANDKTGMAKRLFAQFLAPQSTVQYFDDAALNAAAAGHANINYFMNAALAAPNSPGISTGKIRIHQALQRAGWDITKLIAPLDLGVPAFNSGTKAISSGDFGNGLGVMINGVQYAFAVATDYQYDAAKKTYDITLRYLFYDVFGLDDDDLTEFGAGSTWNVSAAKIGITAWWQLQHQHGYAPLVTRIIVDKKFSAVPAV